MRVMWRAAFAVVFILAATTIETGCGNVYRPVATPLPSTTANPAGAETEVVLSCCLNPASQNAIGPSYSSELTDVDVSGDTNMGNKTIANLVGNVVFNSATPPVPSAVVPVTPTAAPMAFDYLRTSVFTANTATDSVTQVLLSSSTSGFSANATTISLEPGSKPIGISFQYFGGPYTQDYVVNSGTATTLCPGTGSLSVIAQPASQLTATACVGPTPVSAWIYKDQSKVFVLDSNGSVYVVSASNYRVTNTITVGTAPIKAAQSNDGNYIYVLNGGSATISGSGSISIIDGQGTAGQPETVINTIPVANPLSSALPIDIAQDTNFNDTTANTQINHVWVLQADGTVSVWDGTVPGKLTWITSLSTITTPAQVAAKAYPTNLALMRDGTGAYVGLGNTNQIVGINTAALATGVVTTNAITPITLDVIGPDGASHGNVTQTIANKTVTIETTTPTVNYVAVSRGGNSSDLSKVYATTTTSTTYYYYDANANLTSSATYPNLYNGTAVVSAAGNGTTPINTFLTTILAPSQVTYCSAVTGGYDGQKNCPATTPVMVLGRS